MSDTRKPKTLRKILDTQPHASRLRVAVEARKADVANARLPHHPADCPKRSRGSVFNGNCTECDTKVPKRK